MNFREIEDVPKFSQETGSRLSSRHERVLDAALTPRIVDDMFRWIARSAGTPILHGIGCSAGDATAQIARRLSQKGIADYRLICCHINQELMSQASNRSLADQRISPDLRNRLDYPGVEATQLTASFHSTA